MPNDHEPNAEQPVQVPATPQVGQNDGKLPRRTEQPEMVSERQILGLDGGVILKHENQNGRNKK